MADNKTKTKPKKELFFKSGYDLYSDKNPLDTVRVTYKTIQDLKKTISKIETLYKTNKITHSRTVQIANIILQRIRVILKNNKKGDIKEIKKRLNLISSYFEFLKSRTPLKEDKRKKLKFNI